MVIGNLKGKLRNNLNMLVILIAIVITILSSMHSAGSTTAENQKSHYVNKVAPTEVVIYDLKNNKTEIIRIRSDEEEVPVIVEFKQEPLIKYKKKLLKDKKFDKRFLKYALKSYKSELKKAHRSLNLKIKREFFHVFNGIATKIKKKDIEKIKKHPHVKNVWIDDNLTILLSESVPLINADDVWKEQNATGHNITGLGIIVAIIDTGIDYTHPDLGNCTTDEFLNGQCDKVIYGYDFYNNDTDPMDDNGHGTHCAGIVGANGTLKGVAPGVKFLAYKVCSSSGSCPNSAILSAIENATLYGADVISMSLGGSGYADNPFTEAIDNAIANGTVVVIAGGNSGSDYDTIESPGATISAITVGASDKSDNIASFSSRGFAYYSNGSIAGIKPDVLAPGVDINSTVPTGSCENCDPSGYKVLSGTSMATPHVAGVVALLKQAHPDWTPEIIKASIMNPAVDLGYDPLTQGSGRVDAFESYNITGVVVEGSLFFIDAEDDDKIWNETKSLNLTNLVGYNNFSITASITQEGIEANTSKKWINLTDKLSEKFNLTVEVNNTKVSDGRYFGVVTLDANSTLRVPFAIRKVKILTIYLGEDFWTSYFLKVVNGSYDEYMRARNGTNYLEKGEYHIVSTFLGCPPWIPEKCSSHERTHIFSYVNLTSQETLYINKSMAKYKWNYTIYDVDGNELVSQVYPEGEFGYRYQCRLDPWYTHTCTSAWTVKLIFNNTWVSSTLSSGTISPLFFNDANESYWTFFDFHTVGVPNPPSFYIAKFGERGVNSNKTLVANTWSNLTVKYEFPPNISVGHMYRKLYIEKSHGDNWVTLNTADNRIIGTNDTSYKNYEIFYVVPISVFENFTQVERAGDFFSLELYNGTLDYQRNCNGNCSTLLVSPYIEAKNETTFIHRIFAWFIPEIDSNYTMGNNIYKLFKSPSWWDGRFDNNDTTIKVVPRLESSKIVFFRKQSNARQTYYQSSPENLTYDLINSTGDIIKANETVTSSTIEITGLNTDRYTMIFYWRFDWLGNNWTWTVANLTFNLSKTDKNPPHVEFFRITQNSTIGNIFQNGSDIKIVWKISDDTSIGQHKLFYKKHADTTWIELPISTEQGYNTSTITLSETGTYDLKLEASDTSGNTLTQTQYEAFESATDYPPTWVEGTNSTNSTMAGQSVEHRLKWEDDFGLSGFIFSFDNCTGSFVNDSWVPFPSGGTEDWSNVTKVINNTLDCTIRWRVYANDTSNNWNASDVFSYNTSISKSVFVSNTININTQTSKGTTFQQFPYLVISMREVSGRTTNLIRNIVGAVNVIGFTIKSIPEVVSQLLPSPGGGRGPSPTPKPAVEITWIIIPLVIVSLLVAIFIIKRKHLSIKKAHMPVEVRLSLSRGLVSFLWGMITCLIVLPINTYLQMEELYLCLIEVVLMSVIFYYYYSNIEVGALLGLITGLGYVIILETMRVFTESVVCPPFFIIYPFIGAILGGGISTMKEFKTPRGKIFGFVATFLSYLVSVILLYIFKTYFYPTCITVEIA